MSSRKNPIVIKKNGQKIQLHELKYEMGIDFTILEMYDKKGFMVGKYEVNPNSLISIDSELEEVQLIYRTSNGKEIGKETISLSYVDKRRKTKSEDEVKYEYYFHKLLEILENPTGTQKEITQHTALLREATVSENASKYIKSKIRRHLSLWNAWPSDKIDHYTYRLFADLYGMGVLQELDDDPTIGEIMVNAVAFPTFDCKIYYVRDGVKYQYDKTFKNLSDLEKVFDRIIYFSKKERNNMENSTIEATRPNRDRITMVTPFASENWVLNIRKFTNFTPNLEMMKKSGTVNDFIEGLTKVLVKGRANIGVGGPMGTGKTSYLNYMLTYTEPIERKVVISSVPETDTERTLKGHDVVILNVDNQRNFTFNQQLVTSLRTSAARVIIPESRGGEFKQLFEANLKVSGSMFTAHALDDESFMDMCVDMYLSSPDVPNESTALIKNKLTKGIDIVYIMRKVGGKIRIKSISEVGIKADGTYDKMVPLVVWKFNPDNPLEGEYVRTENRLSTRLKHMLNENGVLSKELEEY